MDIASRSIHYYQYRSGRWQQIESGVIAEQPVSVTVNGEVWLTLMCTPVDLEALAIGFLFNENLIQSMNEVASVRVCPTADNVDVWLHKSIERPKDWRRTSGCTGGITSAGEYDATKDRAPATDEIATTLPPELVNNLVSRLFESQELYKVVGGVHTSALADGEEILVVADDIGRHNTLDKIAGHCIMDGISSKNRILVTTGRVSSEMLQKAARLEVSVLISRTSPSSLSIELARKWGITLIGYARKNRFSVYACPERIQASETETVKSDSVLPAIEK